MASGWLRALSKLDGVPEIFPIPGTTGEERVIENSKEVDLSQKEMKELDEILKQCEVVGDRYHEFGMKFVNL
jgi:pyridoxine 4-dehydrogenase